MDKDSGYMFWLVFAIPLPTDSDSVYIFRLVLAIL